MTATDIEVHELTWLDSDWDLPCEADWRIGCKGSADPARWIAFKSCCSARGLLICESCKDDLIKTEDTMLCGECETAYTPARHIVRRFDALDRRGSG